MGYSGAAVVDDGEDHEEGIPEEPGVEPKEGVVPAAGGDPDATIARLPMVKIRLDATPEEFNPGRFLAAMVDRVLGSTPVTMHRDARKRRVDAAQG